MPCRPLAESHVLRSRAGRLLLATALVFALGCASSVTGSADTAPQLACDGLPGAKTSPLVLEQQAVRMRPVTLDELPGVRDEYEPDTGRLAGVVATVPAPPGWSRAWLERRILCYRQLTPAAAGDVLLVDGSTLRVRESRGQLEVFITSEDARVAQQIAETAALNSSSQTGPIADAR